MSADTAAIACKRAPPALVPTCSTSGKANCPRRPTLSPTSMWRWQRACTTSACTTTTITPLTKQTNGTVPPLPSPFVRGGGDKQLPGMHAVGVTSVTWAPAVPPGALLSSTAPGQPVKDKWAGGWVGGRMDGWVDEWTDRRIDGSMDRWMDGSMDPWIGVVVAGVPACAPLSTSRRFGGACAPCKHVPTLWEC
eukprot:366088-Chlamydomonas_euryale.AAC.20